MEKEIETLPLIYRPNHYAILPLFVIQLIQAKRFSSLGVILHG